MCPKLTQTLVPELQLSTLLAGGECARAQKIASTDEDHYQVGKCFYVTGDYTQSETVMRQLLARPTLWADVRMKVLYALAKLASHSNRWEEAIQFYHQVLEKDPESLESLCHIALLEMQQGAPAVMTDPVIQYVLNTHEASHLALKCVVAYARESPTLYQADVIADLSCQQMLRYPATRDYAWTCRGDNLRKWYRDDPGRVQAELAGLDIEHEAALLGYVKQNAQDKQLLTTLGNFWTKIGHPERAADVFEIISQLEADPDARANALEKAASSYFLAGNPELANAMWVKLKAIPGHEGQYIRGQALVAIAQLRFEDAMKILEDAKMVPSPLHRLASGARIAAFLSTKDYSRVGKKSAKVFEQAQDWCTTHLQHYPDDDTVMHSYEYVNWRVQESAGKFQDIVSDRTDRLINIGRQWNTRLAAVYLTYAALAYLHRGKGYQTRADRAMQAKADFDKAEAILMEVMAHKDEMLASGDVLNIYNLTEAWLSLGWSKHNRGDVEAADRIFSAVVDAQEWPADKNRSVDLYDWPKQKILPKQMVEAYRGVATSRDRVARSHFFKKAYETAAAISGQAVKSLEDGLALEQQYIGGAPVQFSHVLNLGIVDGDPDVLREEQHAIVAQGYVTYIHYFDRALHTESIFNLSIAQYWNAKILREWGKMDLAAVKYEAAEKGFLAVLQQAPDHAETHRFLEYIYAIHKGDMDAAEGHFKKAMEYDTAQPIDALLKMVEGYDSQINSDVDLSLERMATRNTYKIKRLHYAIQLADADSNPRHLERALGYAKDLLGSVICDGSGSYRDPLVKLVNEAMLIPADVASHQRSRLTQNHAQLLGVLRPCFTAHNISLAHVVSLAPVKR